ncbi:MAG: cytochrome d ubiquinol oxidase subunit II [Candidatus Eremiobacteraeota bacterium]|nr:cytochrome d ubiquinol oxidase subunit II [Candidatus Eremiobacteraeota bacterium]
MSIAGFIVVAFMITMYVLLDGYDLGVAAIVPLIGRTDRERGAAMESIGPFWNGNEVWLIAAAAALFALFPAAYAASFSGFYLPFILVLWLLMFRGVAIELREHLASELWHQFWDASFALSSALLIVLFGLSLGNVLRGVPLDASGYFQGTFAFLLNPYALLVAAFALATLAVHGAAFAAMRIDGQPAVRAMQLLRRGWWVVVTLFLAVTALTIAMRPPAAASWLVAMPMLSLGALIAERRFARRASAAGAFAMSCAFIATLLTAAAGTLYPSLLPGFPVGEAGITIFNASPSLAALSCALVVSIAGIVAVAIYAPIVWRRMGGKVHVE